MRQDQVRQLLDRKKIEYIIAGSKYKIRCLNPEHEDRNPSMLIDGLQGFGHCFSCGFNVNIFTHFNVYQNKQVLKVTRLKNKISDLLWDISGLELPGDYSPVDKNYRGVSKSTLERYGAFFSDEKPFADRLVFPIKDITGKIRFFIGRHLYSEEGMKYRMEPPNAKVFYFPQDVQPYLGCVILVEGIFDALNLIDKGLSNVICSFGTTTLEKRAESAFLDLKLKGVSFIYIMYDADNAGQIAAKKMKTQLEQLDFGCEIIELNEDQDPGDMTRTEIRELKDRLWPT